MIKRFYFFNGLQANQSVLAAQPQKFKVTKSSTSATDLQPTLKVFATQLLANPALTADLKPAFHVVNTLTGNSSQLSESATPVVLNYVNTSMYTTSFATLVTTFGSNLSYNNRNSCYNPLCHSEGPRNFNLITSLDGLSLNTQPVKPSLATGPLGLTRDSIYLSDLKLLTLFFF